MNEIYILFVISAVLSIIAWFIIVSKNADCTQKSVGGEITESCDIVKPGIILGIIFLASSTLAIYFFMQG